MLCNKLIQIIVAFSTQLLATETQFSLLSFDSCGNIFKLGYNYIFLSLLYAFFTKKISSFVSNLNRNFMTTYEKNFLHELNKSFFVRPLGLCA